MKAFIYTSYGSPDNLTLQDIDQPVPEDNEILLKVRAVSLNAYDWRFLNADPFFIRLMGAGFLKPKKTGLGADIAGEVVAVGKDVTTWKVGDEVFGDTISSKNGGLAEFVCVKEQRLARKPAQMSFEEAAAIPMAALTSLQGLRDHGGIQAGMDVMIHGASGGVGTFAVQLAKSFNAQVTAVCSTQHLDRMRELRADHVIDYKKENFANSGTLYDLIFVANGNRSAAVYAGSLKDNGTVVAAGGTMSQLLSFLLLKPFVTRKGKKVIFFVERPNSTDLQLMADLYTDGKVKPVLDKQFSFSDTQDAFRYLAAGHAKGKIIITLP